jgi:hypothetical protein
MRIHSVISEQPVELALGHWVITLTWKACIVCPGIRTGSGTQPASHTMGTMHSFAWRKAAGHKIDLSPLASRNVKNKGIYTAALLICLQGTGTDNMTSHFYTHN